MVALSTKITVASIHIALVRLYVLVELYLGPLGLCSNFDLH